MCAAIIMGHGGTGEGPQQVRSKSIKERGKGKQSANSKKQAKGKECGRRAACISTSSVVQVRLIDCLKSNVRKRALPADGDTAEPKPK